MVTNYIKENLELLKEEVLEEDPIAIALVGGFVAMGLGMLGYAIFRGIKGQRIWNQLRKETEFKQIFKRIEKLNLELMQELRETLNAEDFEFVRRNSSIKAGLVMEKMAPVNNMKNNFEIYMKLGLMAISFVYNIFQNKKMHDIKDKIIQNKKIMAILKKLEKEDRLLISLIERKVEKDYQSDMAFRLKSSGSLFDTMQTFADNFKELY